MIRINHASYWTQKASYIRNIQLSLNIMWFAREISVSLEIEWVVDWLAVNDTALISRKMLRHWLAVDKSLWVQVRYSVFIYKLISITWIELIVQCMMLPLMLKASTQFIFNWRLRRIHKFSDTGQTTSCNLCYVLNYLNDLLLKTTHRTAKITLKTCI